MIYGILLVVAALVGLGYRVAEQNRAAAVLDSGIEYGDTPGVPVMVDNSQSNDSGINPLDRSTWPVGDAVWRFCQAVAFAEGYGMSPNNAPTTHHNPGDLGPGDTGYPGESHGGSVVSLMPDDATGWQALYLKFSRIFAGQSATYKPTMTIYEVAQKYAGDYRNWSRNVANDLGISESMRLIDWYNAQ